jgi:hypothetical protein
MRRGLVVVSLGLGILALVWWATTQAIEDLFTNDEHSERQLVLSMLDGAVSLGLYRQHMWDALIWTVIATPDPLPPAIAAHNAVLDSTVTQLVVLSETQLGFQDPPLRLERVSRTDATLCGARRCQTIRCADATRTCQRIAVP